MLDSFSVRDNIFLPLVLAGKSYAEMERRLTPIAYELGIGELLSKFPYEISEGKSEGSGSTSFDYRTENYSCRRAYGSA